MGGEGGVRGFLQPSVQGPLVRFIALISVNNPVCIMPQAVGVTGSLLGCLCGSVGLDGAGIS